MGFRTAASSSSLVAALKGVGYGLGGLGLGCLLAAPSSALSGVLHFFLQNPHSHLAFYRDHAGRAVSVPVPDHRGWWCALSHSILLPPGHRYL